MRKIGIVRHDRKMSVIEQQKALDLWGADVVWDLGKHGQKLADLLSMHGARKGDTVAIKRLALLPDNGRGTYEKMAADMSALLKTGARILELETGRYCDTKADVAELVAEALRQRAKGLIGNNEPGRPQKFRFTADDLVWIARETLRSDLATIDDKVAAVAAKFPGFNRTQYYKWREKIEAARPETPRKGKA